MLRALIVGAMVKLTIYLSMSGHAGSSLALGLENVHTVQCQDQIVAFLSSRRSIGFDKCHHF